MLFGDVWSQLQVRLNSTLRVAGRCVRVAGHGASQRSRRARTRSFTGESVETLESRSLPTGLALITGTVFDDLTGDGLAVGDPALTGVAVSLYQDGGNGVFDGGAGGGDDTLVGTQTTNAQGRYEFEFLSAGRYFVQQAAIAGHQQRPGASLVTQDITASDALGVPGVLIDDFSTTTQVTTATTTVRSRSSAVLAPEAIGGERDFLVQITSPTGSIALAANDVTPDVLEFTASSVANGTREVIWDGVDGNGATLNPTGLGGVDLTGGGTGRYLEFLIGSDHVGGQLDVKIYTDAGNWSVGHVAIPDTGGAATGLVILPFTSFVTQAGAGANFSKVGAISISISGAQAVDGQLEVLRNYAPLTKTVNFANSQPMSLGNFVWNDTDNNGQFNVGEQPIANVAVDLFADTNNSGDFTPGVDQYLSSKTTNSSGLYQFDSLFPSVYVVRINPSNFATGGALNGFISSTGNTPTPSPDNNVNNDDNGDPLNGQGVVARAVTLTAMAEPITDGDTDANTNLTVDFGFAPTADLKVTKTDDADPVIAGQTLTYTLTITNLSGATANNVTATDPLPAGVTFQSASSTQGAVSQSNGTVTANLGTLAEGAVATVTIVVKVNVATTGTITNDASVTGRELDLDPSNNTSKKSTLVITRADLEIVKTDDIDPIPAGDVLTYTLAVTNHGPSNATGVTVTDSLPANVTFLSASTTQGTVSVVNGLLTANLNGLAVNNSGTITVRVRVSPSLTTSLSNTATVVGNETDPVPSNNSDTEPTVVITRTDLEVVKTDDVDPVTAGNLLTYTMVVTNHGPSDATEVRVSDPLPAGVTFVSATTTQGSVAVANGTLTGTLGNLANNAAATITVTVRVNPSTITNLNNTATVTGNEPDPIPSNNSDSEPTVVIRRTDLAIVKTDDVDPVTAGNLLTYTMVVTNHGPSDATGVSVSDPLPAGVTFVSATTTQGTVSATNGTLTGTLGNLANNATATITVTVRVNPSTTTNLNNTATVNGNEPDPVPSNNQDSEPTVVITRTDLGIVKTDDVDPVTAGNLLTYTMVVTNHGPSDATGVSVSDPLPAGVTFVSTTTTQGSVSVANGTLTGTLGNLANNAIATITVTVRVNPTTTTNLNNTAIVTGRETDSNPANNQDSEPTVVITRTDLEIVKTDDVDPVTAGNLLTYTMVVTNHGPSNATGVSVSDPLPAGVTFVSATTTQGSVAVTNGTLTGTLGNLANNTTATITVTVRVNASTRTNLNNTATVTGRETDSNPANNQDSEPTVVITRTDLEIVKTDDVDPVTAGNLLTYTMVVTNHGPSDATGVTVSDPLPAGITFVSATTTQGAVSVVNGTLTGTLGNILNNATATITVTVRVNSATTTNLDNTGTVTGNEPDPTPGNNRSNQPTVVITRTDLEIVKTDDVDPVTAGNLLTYTMVVTNHGPSDATGVTVSDPLPAGVTFVSATTTQGTVSVANGLLTGTLGGLINNATATITVTVRVNASTKTNLNNTATVTGRETDSNPSNNQDSEPTVVITRTDLEIVKTDDVDPVTAGNLLTYTMVVTNHGPSDATGVRVSDPLPAGVTFVSATTTQGSVAVANGTLTGTLGNLANNATATITVTVRVNPSTTTNLNNTATVTGNDPDPVPSNNSDSEPTIVIRRTDLEIVKTDDVDPVTAGNLLTYTMIVTNHGPSDATGVSVSDPLPAGVTFVSATTTQGSVSVTNGTLTGTLGNLANNATATITVTVRVNSSTTTALNNTATVAGNEPDPVPSNNQDSEPTQVITITDLMITKTVSATPVAFGQAFSYTLLVMNNGPSDATGVTVVDALPAGLTLDSATTTRGTVLNSNGTITANLGGLPRSATATVTLIVRANVGTSGTVTNTATVSGRETEITLVNNTSQATTVLEPQPASLSGFVYVDTNNDGNFDANELPIAGVTVTLIGTDTLGNAVNLTRQTGSDGAYHFDNLRAGTYRIVESQPTTHRDGKDTPSKSLSAVTTNDQFANITLTAGTNGTAFNFGELRPQLSKKDFLASSAAGQQRAAANSQQKLVVVPPAKNVNAKKTK